MVRIAPSVRAATVSEPPAQPAPERDAALVARMARGDRAALAELYARHQRPLLRYLGQLTPDAGLAEELLQDTFAAAWQSARAFEGRAAARTWLFGIARRRAHDAFRRRRLPTAGEDALAGVEDAEPGPEAHALRRADAEALAAAIARLPVIHREVVILNFVDGLRYDEIAEVVGVPVGTVKSRLSHAKRALRGLMQPPAPVGDARSRAGGDDARPRAEGETR